MFKTLKGPWRFRVSLRSTSISIVLAIPWFVVQCRWRDYDVMYDRWLTGWQIGWLRNPHWAKANGQRCYLKDREWLTQVKYEN